jgi:beta-carotene 3-hydroxylase
MEGVAWFLHKYVMHGFGWYLHEDHHRASKGKFEKNDLFGLFFSLLSFILILHNNKYSLLFFKLNLSKHHQRIIFN